MSITVTSKIYSPPLDSFKRLIYWLLRYVYVRRVLCARRSNIIWASLTLKFFVRIYRSIEDSQVCAEFSSRESDISKYIRYVQYGIIGRTYHAAMYDITAISAKGAFVNRCDLENLRHARRSIRSQAPIKGIVRTGAGGDWGETFLFFSGILCAKVSRPCIPIFQCNAVM